jgi:trigger factor
LEINFDIFLDKVPVENGQQQKYPITIGENRFIPGFEEKLVGMKAGEIKEFELRFPQDYYEKNLAGQLAEFRVSCLAVYEITEPAIDDDFAKQISGGKFTTAQELRDNIKKNLEEEKKVKLEGELENQLLEKIVALSKFGELPDVLLENEAHRMVHELEEEIAHQGLKFEDYLSSIKKTHDDLEKDFRPRAELRVKTSILSREIYQEQKLSVSDEEINQEIQHILSHYSDNEDAKKQVDSPYYREYLGNKLGNQKVMEFLKGKIVK